MNGFIYLVYLYFHRYNLNKRMWPDQSSNSLLHFRSPQKFAVGILKYVVIGIGLRLKNIVKA